MFNFKEEESKTSIYHQISVYMALLGFNVLTIDCDPQAYLTHALGFQEGEDFLLLCTILYCLLMNIVEEFI